MSGIKAALKTDLPADSLKSSFEVPVFMRFVLCVNMCGTMEKEGGYFDRAE